MKPLQDGHFDQANFDRYQWNGEVAAGRLVPENFSFTSMKVRDVWDCWHFGHRGNRIVPYKLIGKDVYSLKCKQSTEHFSKATAVMSYMMTIGIELEEITEITESTAREYGRGVTAVENDRIFKAIYRELTSRLYPESQRRRQVSFDGTKTSTIVNRFHKYLKNNL